MVNLAMVCVQRLGMPVEAVMAHSETLTRPMKYTVKTVYGISSKYYMGTALAPLAGTGQVSGESPAVWLTICIVILTAYGRVAPQNTKFQDPTGTLSSERYADAFVDDTSLGFTDNSQEPPSSPSTIFIILQECARTEVAE